MMLYLFDKNKELIEVLDTSQIINHEQESKLNGQITAEVEGIYQSSVDDAFYFGATDPDNRSIFWRYKIIQKTNDNGSFKLNGVYELFDDLKSRTIIIDKRPQDQAVSVALATVLADTGWEVGVVNSERIGTASWYYETPLNAFWELLDKWNVEFKPRMTFSKGKVTGKYIDIENQLSGDYGKWYEYGDKLLSVVAEQRNDEIYTAFYGRGKGEEVGDGYGRRINFKDVEWSVDDDNPLDKPLGQEYLEFPQATAEYGYEDGTPRYTVVIFEDIEDESELLQATYEYGLNEIRPKAQFKADVLEDELVELGETVAIVRDDVGIRYKTRVFDVKKDFLNKRIKTVEFGDVLVKTRAEQSKSISDSIKKNEEQTIDWLNDIRDGIVNDFFNENGYDYDLKVGNKYDLPAGRYSFDAPIDQDPTKVVYLGAGKLLIANSKLPNGDWDWKTAADGDGFVADVINTGTLNADLIRAGVLQDHEGNFYLNMNNGELLMSGGYLGDWVIKDGYLYANTGDNGYTILKTDGDVAFATHSPQAPNTNRAGFQIWHDGTARWSDGVTTGTNRIWAEDGTFRMTSTDNMLITPRNQFIVNGHIVPRISDSDWDKTLGRSNARWAELYVESGGINEGSDVRQKKEIKDIPLQLLEQVAKEIKPKQYVIGDKVHYGYIAQDVERALYKHCLKDTNDVKKASETVKKFKLLAKDESYKSLIYSQIAVLKDAQKDTKIKELEKRMSELEERLDAE